MGILSIAKLKREGAMKSGLRQGKLSKWKDDRGFGFIQPSSGEKEVFLHISDLKDSTRRPKVGDQICYYLVVKDGKTKASDAFILGARAKASSEGTQKPSLTGKSKSSVPVVGLCLLLILPLCGSLQILLTTRNPLPLLVYPVISLITFVVYADDKARAKAGRWRTQESILHLCELLGGWPGGLVAQRKLRHKTLKQSYQVVFWIIVTVHQLLWIFWLFSQIQIE